MMLCVLFIYVWALLGQGLLLRHKKDLSKTQVTQHNPAPEATEPRKPSPRTCPHAA